MELWVAVHIASDVYSRVRVDTAQDVVCVDGDALSISPLDKQVLMKGLSASPQVQVVSVCPQAQERVLRYAAAMGAPQVFRINDCPRDAYAAAAEVAAFLKDRPQPVVLCGESGWDYASGDFPRWLSQLSGIALVEGVCAAAPDCRVRLGSLEPRTITAEFCRRGAALPNLCPHFHLSMQSGCDATLKRMNRKYDTARYAESVRLLRAYFDRPGITTDLIVGFPGETEEEFAQTLDFIQACAFSAMHIFPYSRRTGTPAAAMEGQIPNAVKEERAHRAGAAARAMHTAWLESWVGQTLPVLFEEEKDGLWRGHAPNYTEVFVPGRGLHNVIAQTRITGLHGEGLLGEIIN